MDRKHVIKPLAMALGSAFVVALAAAPVAYGAGDTTGTSSGGYSSSTLQADRQAALYPAAAMPVEA